MCLIFCISLSSCKLHRIVCVLACDGYQFKFVVFYGLDGRAYWNQDCACCCTKSSFVIVLGALLLIVVVGVQPKKHVGRKKPILAVGNINIGRRWSNGVIANILDLYGATIL